MPTALLYGDKGWCQADEPEFRCPCLLVSACCVLEGGGGEGCEGWAVRIGAAISAWEAAAPAGAPPLQLVPLLLVLLLLLGPCDLRPAAAPLLMRAGFCSPLRTAGADPFAKHHTSRLA